MSGAESTSGTIALATPDGFAPERWPMFDPERPNRGDDRLSEDRRPFVHEVAQSLHEPVIDYVRLQISAKRA
jgi:hypothetical protein